MNWLQRLLLVLAVAGLAFYAGRLSVHPILPPSPNSPAFETIHIRLTNTGQPYAESIALSQMRGDKVRWVNHTAFAFKLEFRDTTGQLCLNCCPLNVKDPIDVAPHDSTRFYPVSPQCPQRYYHYQSTITPTLTSGPPDEPGMTVDP